MALNVAGRFANGLGYLSSYIIDVIGVYDQNFNQLFRQARPMKASIKMSAKIADHPVETGSIISDNRVIQPIRIELPLVFQPNQQIPVPTFNYYLQTYNEMLSVYNGLKTVIVQTKTGLYKDFLIEEMPHEESPDHYDTITMILKLRQILFVKSKTSALPGGNKNGEPANPKKAEDAAHVVKKSSAAHKLIYDPHIFD